MLIVYIKTVIKETPVKIAAIFWGNPPITTTSTDEPFCNLMDSYSLGLSEAGGGGGGGVFALELTLAWALLGLLCWEEDVLWSTRNVNKTSWGSTPHSCLHTIGNMEGRFVNRTPLRRGTKPWSEISSDPDNSNTTWKLQGVSQQLYKKTQKPQKLDNVGRVRHRC